MNKILISPTAFKGTLGPSEAAAILFHVFKYKFPRAEIDVCPLADGGDGMLDVLQTALKARLKKSWVRGPLGKPVRAAWGIAPGSKDFSGKTAIIEMANASGLKLIRRKNKILEASSFGSGQLIKLALQAGCKNVVIGVGGTASSDGGAGALRALGLKYFDKNGAELSEKPIELSHLSRVDWSNFDSRVFRTKIYVVCDVRNPLLGRHGSARTFGPQKGASPKEVLFLEKTLANWVRFSKRNTKQSRGSGAAGGMGFGLSGFAKAHLVQGSDFIIDKLNWTKYSRTADVIITGEGRLDATSFQGKAIDALCRNRGNAKIYVVCGSSVLPKRFLLKKGIAGVIQMGMAGVNQPSRALKDAAKKLADLILKDQKLCKQ